MKKFGFIVAALCMCATASFAQKPSLSREPFIVSTGKLANYLQLTSTQVAEVAEINAYFIEKQEESARACAKKQEQKRYEAVYGNLKLMKKALNPEQYRKYVALINVSRANQPMAITSPDLEAYLAEK